ncbi:tRNA (adenine22-N1)-methyltransferase [Alkalibacillus filiformis]|uniref:tRNA (Adenine22-N1)-methyltransferase n=1 Tax=Alkalibacillus filiformis TaxID=200990 RepID=A0ABU0DRI3_9BACI|nr:class I SAM-dependent methyltransferase [Alkalibacillus filiformis]MDQ0351045.1 tRNA (adenine22-N1)-methyltransferase [Alkalibacillus filiformis]
MKEIDLSKRLSRVKQMIPDNINCVADIGSDHAYLPCKICLERPDVKAIAGEVNEGPYRAAVKQVEAMELSNRIDVRLGDGLEVLSPEEVDCVTIAGMGGTLITNILKNGINKLSEAKALVLQPNIDASSIREFAIEQQYEIVNEDVIEEDGYIYEVVVLTPSDGKISYSAKEIYLGPIMLQSKNEAFYKKWRHVFEKKQSIITQMKQASEPNHEKINQFEQQLTWIKEEVFE